MSRWQTGAQMRLIWGLVIALAAVQAGVWAIAGSTLWRLDVGVAFVAGWAVTLSLALLASRRIGALANLLAVRESAHRATLDEIEQLQTQNAMLDIVARSVDVPLTFQALAVRVARLVPCDRVGLALLSESGEEFETFTARVHEEQPRSPPKPDVVFRTERTAIGQVVRTRDPLIIDDLAAAAADFLDANVLFTSGFRSALVLPLVSRGRGVGTLNVVARADRAFGAEHVEMLRPIAEILAVAHVAQRLHMLLAKYRTIEAMADVTLAVAAEINSALQTLAGQCGLLERSYPDPALQRDLATIVRQAHRIAELLEKMRTAAQERLQEVANTMEQTGMPTAAGRQLP